MVRKALLKQRRNAGAERLCLNRSRALVFGDEVGGPIASIKTAWRTAGQKASITGLHFHDVRREFACRLLESRAELHDVRDFLGHTNPTPTRRENR